MNYIQIDVPTVSKNRQPKGDVPLPAKIVLSDEGRIIHPDGQIVISRFSRTEGRIIEYKISVEVILYFYQYRKIKLNPSLFQQIERENDALKGQNNLQRTGENDSPAIE